MPLDIDAGYTHLEAIPNVRGAPLAFAARNMAFCYVGGHLFGTVLDLIFSDLGRLLERWLGL